jgi:hypothetical protein
LPEAQPASTSPTRRAIATRTATTVPRAADELAAVGAEADDLDAIVGRHEAVLLRGGRDHDHAMAVLAEQVVMMLAATEPVALLKSRYC